MLTGIRVVGYTAVAFNQIAVKRVDPKSHVNILDGLVSRLRSRPGVVYLKRLTIVLDEDSEKGFGLVRVFVLLLLSWPCPHCRVPDKLDRIAFCALRPTLPYSDYRDDVFFGMPHAYTTLQPDDTHHFSSPHASASAIPSQAHASARGD